MDHVEELLNKQKIDNMPLVEPGDTGVKASHFDGGNPNDILNEDDPSDDYTAGNTDNETMSPKSARDNVLQTVLENENLSKNPLDGGNEKDKTNLSDSTPPPKSPFPNDPPSYSPIGEPVHHYRHPTYPNYRPQNQQYYQGHHQQTQQGYSDLGYYQNLLLGGPPVVQQQMQQYSQPPANVGGQFTLPSHQSQTSFFQSKIQASQLGSGMQSQVQNITGSTSKSAPPKNVSQEQVAFITKVMEEFSAHLKTLGNSTTEREDEKLTKFINNFQVRNMEVLWGFLIGLREGMDLGLSRHAADIIKAAEKVQTEVKNLKEQHTMSQKQTTDLMTLSHHIRSLMPPPPQMNIAIPSSVPVGVLPRAQAPPSINQEQLSQALKNTKEAIEATRLKELNRLKGKATEVGGNLNIGPFTLEKALAAMKVRDRDLKSLGDVEKVKEAMWSVCEGIPEERWSSLASNPKLVTTFRAEITSKTKEVLKKKQEAGKESVSTSGKE